MENNEINLFHKEICEWLKKSAQPIVNGFHIKREAEKRKNKTRQTKGVLNTNMLAQYKISEDIFIKKLIQGKQTNHGIFILQDLSGSMIKCGCEAWVNLALIMQAGHDLDIPVKVVGFTMYRRRYTFNRDSPSTDLHLVDIYDSSKGNFTESLLDSFMLFESWYNISHRIDKLHKFTNQIPDHFNMCRLYKNKSRNKNNSFDKCAYGTPTYKAMCFLGQDFSDFLKKTNVDIMNYILITDGEPSRIEFVDTLEYINDLPIEIDIIKFNVDGHDLYIHNIDTHLSDVTFFPIVYNSQNKNDTKAYDNFKNIWKWLGDIAMANNTKLNSVIINIVDEQKKYNMGFEYTLHTHAKKFKGDLDNNNSNDMIIPDMTYRETLFAESKYKMKKDGFFEFKNAFGGVIDSLIYTCYISEKTHNKRTTTTTHKTIVKKIGKKIIQENLSNKKQLAKHPVLNKIGEVLAINM